MQQKTLKYNIDRLLYRQFCLLSLDKLLGKRRTIKQEQELYKKIDSLADKKDSVIKYDSNLSRWLLIHNFDINIIEHIIKKIKLLTIKRTSKTFNHQPIAINIAIDICKPALIKALPLHKNIIVDIIDNGPRCLLAIDKKHKHPFTQDLGFKYFCFLYK